VRTQTGRKGSVPDLGHYCTSRPRPAHLPDDQSLVCHMAIFEGFAPMGLDRSDASFRGIGNDFGFMCYLADVAPGAWNLYSSSRCSVTDGVL